MFSVALTTSVNGLVAVDVCGRLISLFDAPAVVDQAQPVMPGPLSQTCIAEQTGAARALVNRLLQNLARGGYIRVSGERIVRLSARPRRC